MKKVFVLVLCLGLAFLTYGCQSSESRAPEGAVIGGLLGATAGGIIGHQSGHGLIGAGIGAAAGALTGAVVGSQIKKPGQAPAAQTAGSNQVTTQQIIDFTKQGVHEDVIVDKIRLTNSKFILTADDITYLKQQGVSLKVIDAMQAK
jgi:uncharacterized protein YcfJ